MGGPQSQTRRGGDEKKSLHYTYRESNPGCPAYNLAITVPKIQA